MRYDAPYYTTLIKFIAPLLWRVADISFTVETHRFTFIWQKKRQEIKLFLSLWFLPPQCHRRGSDEEACKQSPSRALSPLRALVSSWDVWAPFHSPPSSAMRSRESLLHRWRPHLLLIVSVSVRRDGEWLSDGRTPGSFCPPHNGPWNRRMEDVSRCLRGGVEQRGAHNGFTAGFSARVLLI